MMAERLENRLVLSATIGNNLSVGSELQNYRLAISATAEYTSFFGGQAAALAAIESVVDEVNEIFEEELSISFQLVSGTNTIFTNSSTDGFDNGNTSQMLAENTGILNGILGSNSYDIGHAFGTFPSGGSGLAGLGVVGGSFKGAGVSTSADPRGFDWVNLVAHEFAHQFGAEHTFNADAFGAAIGNREADTAYEPGSGTTLMSYAGISADANGSDDLQPRTDRYLHASSFEAIQEHIAANAPPNSITATGNTPPTIVAGSDFTIPAGTPFELTATGFDADVGDTLTYTWEQLDLGPSMSLPISDNGSSPLFRSFSPSTQSNRVFPQLSDLVSGTDTAPIGEVLPTTTRPLNFRATVRDGNNGVNSDDVLVSVVDTGTPFAITTPNTAVNWTGGSTQTITWAVAGTNANGINAANVAIDLSLDGGLTYPLELIASTANDGSHLLTVPNIDAADARLRIRGIGNVFFDISDADFSITSAPNAAGVTIIETGGTTVVNEDGVLGGNDVDQYSIALNTTPTSSLDVTIDADAQTEISTDGITFATSVTLAMANTETQTIFVRGFDDTIEEGVHAGTITHSITASSDPAYPTTTLINPVSVQIADDELQPLIGVDFDTFSGDSPTNWTRSTGFFSDSLSSLIREDGIQTSVGLTLDNFDSVGLNPSEPSVVPSRSPRLEGIDGVRSADRLIQLTWNGLTPGTDYNLYFLTSESFAQNAVQEIVITGGTGDPLPFSQDTTPIGNGLLVNDGISRPDRSLESDAVVAQADANGVISVSVTKTGGRLIDSAYLSAVAIQEIAEGTRGFNVVQSGDSTIVSEVGTQDTLNVSLKSQPTGTVVINLAGSDATEATISPTTLTFNETNWNVDQLVAVSAVDDSEIDGGVGSTVTLSIDASGTTDDSYDQVDTRVVRVVTQDNDVGSLVGVDFESPNGIDSTPTNWTTITNTFSSNDTNLINELGIATAIDLATSIVGGGSTSDSSAPANLPDHSPSLAGLDGNRFASSSINLTWSDLTPGTDYNVWLFAARQVSNQGDHTVTITGITNPAPFVMGVEAAGFGVLMVNGNVADPANNLQADAITATADANGEIVISVTNTSGEDLIGLSGAAIQELGSSIDAFDFGDAPTASLAAQQTGETSFASDYPVSLADNGARHIPVGPTLGQQRDSEADGIASALADEDDNTGVNDEDGVMFGDIVAGANAGINIELQNAGDARVDAWIDFNKDGVWDLSEKILDGVAVNSGLQTLNYTVPSGADSGVTFARVRVSTVGNLLPTGAALDGEVEDYAVTIASISSARIDNVTGTRSEISSIEVVFDSDVNAVPGDFVLINTDNDQRISGIMVSNDGSGVSTLTFEPGPGVISGNNPAVPPTLDNGNYELRFRPTVQDGSDDPIVIDQFFRKYGETDATSESVGLTDFAAFRGAFGGEVGGDNYRSDLDANRDGIIGLTDFAAFRSGFGT